MFEISGFEEEILVSLEQFDRRTEKDKGKSNYTIGTTIVKVRWLFEYWNEFWLCGLDELTCIYVSLSLQADVNRKYRMHDKLERVHSGPFSNARNVFARVNVRPGRYVIVPSTFEPGCHGKFILRTYSSKGLNFRYDEIVRVLL